MRSGARLESASVGRGNSIVGALQLPPQGAEAAGIKSAEMAMARQLIEEMSSTWSADQFRDSFQAEVMNWWK